MPNREVVAVETNGTRKSKSMDLIFGAEIVPGRRVVARSWRR